MEKNKIKKSAAVFATTLIIIIVGVASFAYFGTFDVNLINNVAVNINAVSPGNASFVSSATQLNLQVPAANMSQTNAGDIAAINTAVLTVNLTGAADLLTTCTYDIVYEYEADSYVYGYGETPATENENGMPDIILDIEEGTGLEDYVASTNGINYYLNGRAFNYFNGSNPTGNYDENDKWDSVRKRVLVRNASISSTGELVTQNWLIVMGYFNLPVSQEKLAGKAFTGKIYVENYDCGTSGVPGYYTILANNGGKDVIEAKEEPDFSKTATAEDSGMYAAEDDLGTSYYFRGVVDNNWVQFGKDSSGKDIYWRIIRINGDGSIRMIYSGTTKPSEDTSVTGSNGVYMTGTGTQITVDNINTFKFNSVDGGPSYVGYMYTEGEQHGNSTSSTIKTTIENWFAGTTLKDNTLVSENQIFCNDRSVTSGSFEDSLFSYAAESRLGLNKSPILTCTTESDKFTSKNSSIGNKTLEYPVGLITADEIAIAGGVMRIDNTSYYLYTNQYYWLGSPGFFYSINSIADELGVSSSGDLDVYSMGNNSGARPVVSLSSKAKLSGSGTYDDVYIVS